MTILICKIINMQLITIKIKNDKVLPGVKIRVKNS
jgi:hypothetical protein